MISNYIDFLWFINWISSCFLEISTWIFHTQLNLIHRKVSSPSSPCKSSPLPMFHALINSITTQPDSQPSLILSFHLLQSVHDQDVLTEFPNYLLNWSTSVSSLFSTIRMSCLDDFPRASWFPLLLVPFPFDPFTGYSQNNPSKIQILYCHVSSSPLVASIFSWMRSKCQAVIQSLHD